MEEFKTPTSKRFRSWFDVDNLSPLKIPATPFLKQIGYGCGVNVFTLERSPKVGFARSPWAIKKRNANLSKDIKYDLRIKFEADILRNLNHPNIVGFRALTLSATGIPCLAMEKLDQSLEEGPITNKTDMWAYGLILWEMIALSPPHVDTGEELSESILNNTMDSVIDDENTNPNNSELLDSRTRPALPAISIGPEYDHILEIFTLCTDQDYKTRPSARGVVMYFQNSIFKPSGGSK
ncbi:Similar to PBK: Lymphokine-activated killer T-cell-originated protein kinase (Homo sapiens) [Cotesia congregata]|uniref:Similar to PBK: Lymphokine-activated killer T-cell-originated protein kinase (Homo sapiens) n=1 Tax=Cotesia congregata TaxID=51543 RepID=A0A8J2HAC9_COTCN|nr:Similar to PBK: Lymphokine-activated killer T-cell-originated protein kinase (Homo sapiens) [Cotesia congregata]